MVKDKTNEDLVNLTKSDMTHSQSFTKSTNEFRKMIQFSDSEMNVDKMSSRKPLNDDDKRSWLITLNQLSKSQLEKLTKQ